MKVSAFAIAFAFLVACGGQKGPAPAPTVAPTTPPADVAVAPSEDTSPSKAATVEDTEAPKSDIATALAPATLAAETTAPSADVEVPTLPLGTTRAQPKIPPDIAAKIPATGLLFASKTDTRDTTTALVIARVAPDGLHELSRTPAPDVGAFGWSDALTLWVVATDYDSHTIQLTKHVVGAAGAASAEPLKIPEADWKLTKGAELPPLGPDLVFTPAGDVWLTACIESAESPDLDGPPKCLKTAWMRVDTRASAPVAVLAENGPPEVVKGRTNAYPALRLRDLPKLATPPPGPKVKLLKVDVNDQKVKGVTCTWGDKKATWPFADFVNWEFEIRPDTLQWIHATPPIFAIEGEATSPIGWTSTGARVFRACEPEPMKDVRWLGDGMWAELRETAEEFVIVDTYWHLFIDGVQVAALDGGWTDFVPAPR